MTPKQANDIRSKQTALVVRPATRELVPMSFPHDTPGDEAKSFPDFEQTAYKAAQYEQATSNAGRVFSPSLGSTPLDVFVHPYQPTVQSMGPLAPPPVIGPSAMTRLEPIGGALAAGESAAEVAAPAAAAALPTAGLAGLAGLGFGLGMQALAGARSPQGSIQDFLPARSGGGQDAAGQAVNQMLQSVLNKLAGLNSRAGGP